MKHTAHEPLPQGNPRAARIQAKIAAKHFVAKMKVRLSGGGRAAITSSKALKVIERGATQLFLTEGRPFAREISHVEAAAFMGGTANPDSRYAMAFAVDENGNPYCTLPVEVFRLADHQGAAVTAQALVEQAEQTAYGLLFDKGRGLWPHRPAHTARGRS